MPAYIADAAYRAVGRAAGGRISIKGAQASMEIPAKPSRSTKNWGAMNVAKARKAGTGRCRARTDGFGRRACMPRPPIRFRRMRRAKPITLDLRPRPTGSMSIAGSSVPGNGHLRFRYRQDARAWSKGRGLSDLALDPNGKAYLRGRNHLDEGLARNPAGHDHRSMMRTRCS